MLERCFVELLVMNVHHFLFFFFSYDKADTNLGNRISLQAVQYILPEKQCDTPWNEMMTKEW